MIRRIMNLLRGGSDNKISEPDLRYGDPSHDPKNAPPKSKKPPELKTATVQRPQARATPIEAVLSVDDLMRRFADIGRLKNLTYAFLRQKGSSGARVGEINNHVANSVLGNSGLTKAALSHQEMRALLSDVRKLLQSEGSVAYNAMKEVW